MDMTPTQIELVEKSFEIVRPIAAQAGTMFYGRLVELNPSLRSLFGDIETQGRKLMQMIGVAVGMLRRPNELLPAVADLGRRHAMYGVRAQHYREGGAALIWTLEQGLGDVFTPDVRDAWIALYDGITWVMQHPETAPLSVIQPAA
jgi:hemoglobin-like flavoprotein